VTAGRLRGFVIVAGAVLALFFVLVVVRPAIERRRSRRST